MLGVLQVGGKIDFGLGIGKKNLKRGTMGVGDILFFFLFSL